MKTLQILAIAFLTLGFNNLTNANTLKTSFYKSGKVTASGEKFSPYGNTAASNHFKLGTILQLSYNGRTAKVCINDTGSFGKYGRQLDVSKAVAKKLKFVKKGVVKLKSKILFKPKKRTSCRKAWKTTSNNNWR